MATMKRGEVAKFTCKSEYAYGETGSPPKIPANATLIFEVELFDWKGRSCFITSLTLSLPTLPIGDVIADCQRHRSATWTPF